MTSAEGSGFARRRLGSRLVVLMMVVLGACRPGADASSTPSPEGALDFEDCQLASPLVDTRLAARCARLEVPEDHLAPQGSRRIALQIARLPAVSRNPEMDALVYLAGGPGQSALESFPSVASAFREINHKRDILLMDQRGTGGSAKLDCPPPEETNESSSMVEGGPEDLDALRRWAADCSETLAQRADLRRYTTADAVDDLELVRRTLGYETLSIYGISYGTRLAQAYAAAHPERVRLLVLDGVVAGEPPLGTAIAQDAEAALRAILDRCGRDADCRAAFGETEADLAAVRGRLEAAPVELELPHPVTGRPTELELTWEMAAFGLRFASYAPETVSLIPLLLDSAAEGELAPLASLYLQLAGEVASTMSAGLHYAVVCSEDLPRYEEAALRTANEGTYLGDQVSDALMAACEAWPTDMDPDRRIAVVDPDLPDVPTLLLSGENDPVTPPRHAERVEASVPRALHLIAAGQGHGIVQRGCAPRVLTDFVERGSLSDLDAACVETMKPASFFLDFSGPAP